MDNRLKSLHRLNEQRILNLLRRYPDLSRSEIARRTRLGKATVSELVSDLISRNLLLEIGTANRRYTAGRRPVGLRLNGGAGLAVGVELTGFECRAVLTDLCARPLAERTRPTPCLDVDTVCDLLVESVEQLLEGACRDRMLGVGVGLPGLISADGQRVLQAVNLGWTEVALAGLLSTRLGLPVSLVMRQAAGALGEYWHGSGRGKKAMYYVSVGLGIGAGAVLCGELYLGATGGAGELGHVKVLSDGPVCGCGKRGCLEALASLPAMLERARQAGLEPPDHPSTVRNGAKGERPDPGFLFDAVRAGDSRARAVVSETGRFLGMALADVVNIINPDLILIDGDIMDAGDLLMQSIRETVAAQALPAPAAAVHIERSVLGPLACPIGAAALVLDELFSLPGAHDYA